MAITTVPFKTPLGNEELRSRVHKLGQRHRTILFLIDGRRPLAEVLSLAHQAGSTTSHFEDLLRMGLVDLPPEPPPVPPARDIPTLTDEARLTTVDMVVLEAVVEQSDLAPVLAPAQTPVPLRLTDVVLPVVAELVDPTDSSAIAPAVAPAVAPVVATTTVPPAAPAPAPAVAATIASFGLPVRSGKAAVSARGSPASTVHANEILSSLAQLRPSAPAQGSDVLPPTLDLQEAPEDPFERTIRQFPHHVPQEPPQEPPEESFERTQQFPRHAPVELPSPAEPPEPRSEPFKTRPPKGVTPTIPVLSESVWASPGPVAPAASNPESTQESIGVPPPPERDEAELLQQIRDLLTDALRLDAPLFSARTFMRVRSAQSTGDLINLVWEIEDHLSHKRRSRRELQSLQHARELLGLGNTLVAGDDSRPDDLDKA